MVAPGGRGQQRSHGRAHHGLFGFFRKNLSLSPFSPAVQDLAHLVQCYYMWKDKEEVEEEEEAGGIA